MGTLSNVLLFHTYKDKNAHAQREYEVEECIPAVPIENASSKVPFEVRKWVPDIK